MNPFASRHRWLGPVLGLLLDSDVAIGTDAPAVSSTSGVNASIVVTTALPTSTTGDPGGADGGATTTTHVAALSTTAVVAPSTRPLPQVIGSVTDASICIEGFTMCDVCCDRNDDCSCDNFCGMGPTGFTTDTFRCTMPHRGVKPICSANFTTCPKCCDRDDDCKCDSECSSKEVGEHNGQCTMPHRALEDVCPVGFMTCPKCCDRELDCACDDHCGMGPTGYSTDTFKCTVPHRKDGADCPPNYFICPNCCDREADCACDSTCGKGPMGLNNWTENYKCTLPRIVEDVKCPASFYICPECCDRQANCECDNWCGLGPTGSSTDDFKCVIPHRSEAECPANFTKCPDCCDRSVDCKCDDFCGMGPNKGYSKPSLGFFCSVPHQVNDAVRVEEESRSVMARLLQFFILGCVSVVALVAFKALFCPTGDRTPLLDGGCVDESEMVEDMGPVRQARQFVSSSNPQAFNQGFSHF